MRVVRVAVWVVGLLLATVVAGISAAILYARTDAGRARVRALVLKQAHQSLPGLDIAHVGGDYVHDLYLDDVSVFDGDGRRAVHVDRVAVRFDLLPLVHKTVHVRELRVEAPVILGRPEEDGTLNLAHLTAPPKPSAGQRPTQPSGQQSAWHLHLDRVRVEEGSADILTADQVSTLVTGLNVDAAVAADGDALTASLHRFSAGATHDGRDYQLALAGKASLAQSALDLTLTTVRVAGLLPADAIDGTARVAGPRDKMAVDVQLRAGQAGRIGLRGALGLIAGQDGATTLGRYDLTLDAAGLTLRRLAEAAPAGQLSLSLAARGHGVPLAPDSDATVTLEVPPARVAGIAIDRVQLRAGSQGPRWEVPRAVVRASGVNLTMAGHGQGASVEGDLAVQVNGRVRRGRGSPLPDVRGRGRLAVHVAGTLPAKLAATATLAARDIATGELRIGAAALNARVAGGAGLAPRGAVHLGLKELLAGAGAPRVDALTLDLASDGRELRVHGAAAGPRLHAGIDARGRVSARAADVTVSRLSLSFESHRYEQALALQRPTTLLFRAGQELRVSPTEVRGTGYLLTGTVMASGSYRLTPTGRGPLAELSLGLRHASLSGFDRIDADLRAALERHRVTANLDAAIAQARLHLDADVPVVVPRSGAPRLATRGPVAVHLTTQSVKLQTLPVLQRRLARQGISGGTVDAALAMDGDIARPHATAHFELREVMLRNVSGLGRDSTLKTIPGAGLTVKLDTEPGSVHLAAQALLRNAGIMSVDARSETDLGALLAGKGSPAEAPLHATVDIPKFKLASLADFTDAMKGVEGTLAGQATITGTPRRPSGRGDITITDARVDKVAFRKVLVHGEAVDGRIDAAVNLTEASGGNLYGQAHIERSRDDAFTARLSAKDLDVGFMRLFLPTVRELGGIMQASAEASGTLASPRLQGTLALAHGKLGVIGQPTFQDVTVAAAVKPGRAELGNLSMRSGGGTLTGKGWAVLDGLTPTSVVFTAHAQRFLVAAAGSTGARIDGDLAVEAALRAAVTAGKVRVPRAVVWLPKGVSGGSRDLQKIGQHSDLRFVDEAALAAADQRASDQRAAAAAPPKRLDLRAQAGPIYVRSKDLDLEIESTLRVSNGPEGAPALTGQVHIRRGRINISGQRFDLDRGEISFNGSPQPDPALDLRLTHQYPDATVVIEIRGTPKHPELRLTSDPPIYDQAQIVSLIVTGQPGGQPSTGKSFDPTAAVATMVLGKLADKVAPELGLDVLRVENVEEKTPEGDPTGDTDTRVEVGKYISDRVFLSYAHVFAAPEGANANEAHVEYRITRRWMLETIFGDAGVGGVDALWTYRY